MTILPGTVFGVALLSSVLLLWRGLCDHDDHGLGSAALLGDIVVVYGHMALVILISHRVWALCGTCPIWR